MGELPFALAPEAALGAWLREAEREMEPHRTAGTYRGFDGTELSWQAVHADRPRAHVVLLHGFTEFPEKYRELCRYLRQAGCTVWLPVLRGHGQGGIVHVDRFEDYVRDMACFLRDIVPERPLLFGHSMGGGVAARLLQERPDCAARAVLCSPMLCPQTGRAPHWLALGCARVLLRRGERKKSPLFSGAYDPNAEFSCSGCTSRARFRAAMDCRAECPAYQTMGASNRWVYESLALRSRVLSPRACRRVQVPVLVCSAGRDTQVSLREQRLLAARLPQGRLLEFPDEKHELYNAGNAGLAAFLGAVLEFFGLTAGYGKEETK